MCFLCNVPRSDSRLWNTSRLIRKDAGDQHALRAFAARQPLSDCGLAVGQPPRAKYNEGRPRALQTPARTRRGRNPQPFAKLLFGKQIVEQGRGVLCVINHIKPSETSSRANQPCNLFAVLDRRGTSVAFPVFSLAVGPEFPAFDFFRAFGVCKQAHTAGKILAKTKELRFSVGVVANGRT
jgi:hypothetical protein